MTIANYDKTRSVGGPLATHTDNVLKEIGEAEKIKTFLEQATFQPNKTTPAAGDNRRMLEIGYAGITIECTVNQSVGASAGNVAVGDQYTGDVTGFVIEVDAQDDPGGTAHMMCRIISGTPLEDELMTADTGNTGKIIVDTLISPTGDASDGKKTGDGDGKYEGEAQVGVEAGGGTVTYDAVIDALTDLIAAKTKYAKLFQGT